MSLSAGDYLRHLQSLGLVAAYSVPDLELPVSFVVNRAADVKKGAVFCAIRGSKFDGHDFLEEARKNGAAVCVVHADRYTGEAGTIAVTDSFYAWGALCEKMHGCPADSLNLYGITGTNGKTSSAILLHYFLQTAGFPCGLLTTIFTDVCDGTKNAAANTMPDAAALQKLFSALRQNKAENLVMECSSHGLAQSRSGSAKYACAIFTNLTGDHLDYHKTMESYYLAKKRLFTSFAAPGMTAVINVDDAYGKRLYNELAESNADVRLIAISAEDRAADLFFEVQRIGAEGTAFRLYCGRESGNQNPLELKTKLTGLHNVYNLTGVLAAAHFSANIPWDVLAAAVPDAPPAPGRLESFHLPSGAVAFVDYAHTDDAILRVTAALDDLRKKQNGGRLITVFGCGGDRDRTKRPRMLAAARQYSDEIIVTSDNPRSEAPMDIIADILAETESGSDSADNIRVIPDRADAIAAALKDAQKNDLILIAGKGHEDYQEIKGVRHHFDDREEIRKFLNRA